MNLVLVESPTKARKLKEYLGKDYQVEASMGHIRDLPKSKLGVDVDHDFEPQYTLVSGRKSIVSNLKKLAAKAKAVYLATDPDREGEAIAWHLQYLLKDKKKKKDSHLFYRSTFHEITKHAVTHALEHPGEINSNLVDAQQARRVVDRLVGYYLSPVLWAKVRRGLSAGRVQSVALRLIVEREREREAFKPVEYWEVYSHVSHAGVEFPIQLVEVDGGKYEPHSKKDVDNVVGDLEKSPYHVSEVEKTERRRSSLPPFTTSTLQQAAAHMLGWSAKMTMQHAQHLYEEGIITYHRTDSTAIAQPALDAARETITARFGKTYLPESPRLFKVSSKNAQEAHESIRPTNPSEQNPKILETVDARHAKLYELIWRRFLASQMNEAVYDQTTVIVSAGKKYTLRTTGSVMKFDGWMTLFPKKDDVLLPEVKKGDALDFIRVQADQKFTQPPARFNDASLVRTLEKLGIGRPSTYASIISVILDRGYVEREEKAFVPTVIGTTVLDFLLKHFPKELDYQFTAEMEDDLDAIARGEKKWKTIVRQFFGPFEKTVAEVKKDAEKSKIPVEETDKVCPECKQGNLVIRTGRFGRFLSCSRFPECKHSEKLVEKVDGMKCPDCGEGDVVVKRTRRGKTFYGCSRYPKCTFASWNKPTPLQQPA